VITARVDRLEQESKRILQEASVIGRSFYYDILKRISDIKDNIDRSLSGLERFNLIRTKSIEPHLEYIFKHALTQEVVYNGLLKKERRKIHERIAHVIEELFTDRLPEFYETLAFHFKGGKSVKKAIKYLMKSGEKSLRRYALDESNQYYQEAFELLKKNISAASIEEKKLFILVLVEWALVYYFKGDFKGIDKLFAAHETIAQAVGNDKNAAMYYAWIGFSLYFRGKPKESYDYLKKAIEIGENSDSHRVVGYACSWIPFTCTALNLFEDGIRFGLRAKEISKVFPQDQYLYFKSRAALGFVYFFLGRAEDAHENGTDILEYGRLHSNLRSQVMGLWIQAFAYLVEKKYGDSIGCLENALQISSDPFYLQFVKLLLGNILTAADNFIDAEKFLIEVLNFSRTYGCEVWEEWILPDLEKIEKSKKRSIFIQNDHPES
jgi:tetratricopeptide (TPR) repeat protein